MESTKDHLMVSNSNRGIGAGLLAVQDGQGDDSPLYLSTSQVKITSDTLALQGITANAVGGGFDGAETSTVYVSNLNGEIVTTILVDLTGLLVSGTVKDIIGEDGVAASYITQITTAVNGVVYKAEMSCIEVPTGSNTTADLDLITNSASLAEDVEYDSSGSAVVLFASAGAWTLGEQMYTATSAALAGLVDDYLYLVNGSGANSGGTFTGGKFIIKLYGASF